MTIADELKEAIKKNPKPYADENGRLIEPDAHLEPEIADEEEEAHDALGTIADALVGIEKHLFALVYLAITGAVEKTGVGYVPEVFNAIYDDSDPFSPENMPKPIPDGTAPADENASPA
jgi:hypothetical protein